MKPTKGRHFDWSSLDGAPEASYWHQTFNSSPMKQGGTYTFTFSESGTFQYCGRFHGDKARVDMAR